MLGWSASMAKTPQVGEQAPDFELEGTDGPFRLSEHRGERVVLLFYPGDNTMVCTKQFCSYRDRAQDFAELNATVVGISSQDIASHEGFVAKHGLNVPLLADVDKRVAKAYGAFSPRLGTKRAVVVIDDQGVVRYRHDHLLSSPPPWIPSRARRLSELA
jgi:thioredoxin-dependent peroxiredoxin